MPKKKPRAATRTKRTLDARPDTLDFRDQLYIPTLVEVPPWRPLEQYQRMKVPLLDQGTEGACTGFGLATVANFLLRSRSNAPDTSLVSARMLYQMARRYDEWQGEDYDGSSARGAMKGWHKHGVCSDDAWPYKSGRKGGELTPERIQDATFRPLGAYFRVNHKDLVSMHSAISEVGILYATASVHSGWENLGADGVIPFEDTQLGGHAFAIVAYDQRGLWIQNSWGPRWGLGGFALITYDDWLVNATDVWVARLGAPVILNTARAVALANADRITRRSSYSFQDLRPHIVSVGNDGKLCATGQFGNSAKEVQEIFEKDFPRITQNWKKKRILLYAHGGLTGVESAIQRVADYRPALLNAEVYPISLIWKTDYWTTLSNILRDALNRRKPEGFLDGTKDFMLDRLDDALEPLARALTGKIQWDEMKENGALATTGANGGARLTADYVAELAARESVEIHLVGHSAGSIFHAPLVQYLTSKDKIADGPLKGRTGLGLKVETCTLWAPACTVAVFKEFYLPAIRSNALRSLAMFILTDAVEQDDHCANVYHKSLLYLVSHAFEARPRIPLFREGEPILGMEKFVTGSAADKDLQQLFTSKKADLVLTPNDNRPGSPNASKARHHGDFDNDAETVKATLARVLGQRTDAARFRFNRSARSVREERQSLNSTIRFGEYR